MKDVHVHSHPSKVEHWRHVAEIAAILVAAVWALYVFVFQEQIKPARELPELQAVWFVDHQALPHGAELVRVNIVAKNMGTQEMYIAGAIVSVYGIRYGATPRAWGTSLSHGFGVVNHSLPETTTTLLYSYVHAFAEFHGTGFANVEPQTGFTRNYSFAIPSHVYDAVKLKWIACQTKYGDRTWPVSIVRTPDGAYAFTGTENASGLFCYSDVHDAFAL